MQIKKITTEQQKPYLFLDSGNLLFKQAQIPGGPSQERLTAAGIIKIYTAMKVDAVAVAPLDLASGLALLQTTQQQGFPWLSANLLDQQGLHLFQPVRIKKIGKIKAGIIGLTGALSSLPPGITRAEWQTILPALIEETSHQCDILILLSSLSPAENQEIAQQFPALHLILAADPRGGNMNPQQVNNTLITQTDRQGKYQGFLTIDWNKSGRWGKAGEEELNNLRNKLGALDWQLERMRTRKDLQQPEYIVKIKQIERDRETLAQQIMTLEQSPAIASADGKSPPCSFTNKFLALQQALAEAPEIKALVTDIKRQINDIHRNNSNRDIDKNRSPQLLGHDSCNSCHPSQTRFWQKTHHARAYQTLQGQGQANNLECLPCHVTFSPGLTLSKEQLIALPPTLQTVGCENCHAGPGISHASNPGKFPLTKQVNERTCLSCHTKERDKQFDYQRKMALIACPAG